MTQTVWKFSLGKWALTLAIFWAALAPMASWALSDEENAFKAAFGELTDKQYHQAELDFTTFLDNYSNSPYASKAALCKAEAQSAQSNNIGALDTLQSQLPRARDLAPDYIFYIAKATNALGNYEMAARGFANVALLFPQSPLRLEAAYDEADEWSKIEDWPRVIDLLSATNKPFQIAAQAAGASNIFALNGKLLLGKAYLESGQPALGEALLRGMATNGLGADLGWERQYLLCQLELAGDNISQAETDTTNLIARTEVLGSAQRGLSLMLRGEILERRGKLPEALTSYTNNLADDALPEELQRDALARALQLLSRQGQTNAAVALLEDLSQRPHFHALDLARLSLGEYYLDAFANKDTNTTALFGTNLLQRAGTNFESVLRDFPNSPLRGRAQLDEGWRNWADTNIASAQTNFQEAVNRLPHSDRQAVARFKLADAELYAHDNAAALSNYQAVIRDYHDLPAVTNNLFDLALYKVLETSLELGDQTQASDAAAKIMAWFPKSYYGGLGILSLGEDLARKNDYATAREEFTDLLKKPTQLRADAEYAIARTYGLEGNWEAALPLYDQWLTNHAQSVLLPRVEYDRALAYDKAGQGSNALIMMTNIVASFPSNNTAPWAQNWVANYYLNQSDFENAEKNFEVLYGKWPNADKDLAYWARFFAGKSALGRGDTHEASDYFLHLINDDPNAPHSIVDQAYYALGDTFIKQFILDQKNVALLNQAIAALSKLTNGAPTNAMAPLAFGRLGDCYFQGKDDAGAMRMYQAALSCTNVIDVATRSKTLIAMGNVARDMNDFDQALSYYDKVLYDPEQNDPFWITQAATAAAAVCEDEKRWDAAIKIYQRALNAAPALRPMLETKIAAAQRMMDAAKN